jgi:hypothetical protein
MLGTVAVVQTTCHLFFWHSVSLFFLFTDNFLDLIPKPCRVISQFYKILGFRTLAH